MKCTNFIPCLIFLIFILLFISSCTEKDLPVTPPESSYTLEDYYPLSVGLNRTYGFYDNDSLLWYYNDSIDSSLYLNGKNCWRSKFQSFDEDSIIQNESINYYHIENDSLYSLVNDTWMVRKSLSGWFNREVGDTIHYPITLVEGHPNTRHVTLESLNAVCPLNGFNFDTCMKITTIDSIRFYIYTDYYMPDIGLVYSRGVRSYSDFDTTQQFDYLETKLISYSE